MWTGLGNVLYLHCKMAVWRPLTTYSYLNIKVIKIKLNSVKSKIHFHMITAQWPHGASGYPSGYYRYRTVPLLQKSHLHTSCLDFPSSDSEPISTRIDDEAKDLWLPFNLYHLFLIV